MLVPDFDEDKYKKGGNIHGDYKLQKNVHIKLGSGSSVRSSSTPDIKMQMDVMTEFSGDVNVDGMLTASNFVSVNPTVLPADAAFDSV